MNKNFLLVSVTMFSMFSQAYASELLITIAEDDNVKIVDYNTVFSEWDSVANFNNPCYEKGKTQRHVLIPNGSMLNFAANGFIGDTIRTVSAFNETQNPLGIAHSGVVVNDDPREIFSMVVDLLPGGKDYKESNELSETEGNALINELKIVHYDVISAASAPKISAPFVVEAVGSVSEVLNGISPFVHVHALNKVILEYDGNVYLRQLKTYIPSEQTRGFVKKYIGRSYESFDTLSELLYAVVQANPEERSENVFCSELAALFYKEIGIIGHDTILSNNVIPEMLSSGAGANDLLKNKALPDIPLKISFSPEDADKAVESCWQAFIKKICGCCYK